LSQSSQSSPRPLDTRESDVKVFVGLVFMAVFQVLISALSSSLFMISQLTCFHHVFKYSIYHHVVMMFEMDNQATTPISYCPPTAFLPVWPNCLTLGELEETTRTLSCYVDEDYPARPEIQEPVSEWSNWHGSESSTLETDVYVWHYALLVVHAVPERYQKKIIWTNDRFLKLIGKPTDNTTKLIELVCVDIFYTPHMTNDSYYCTTTSYNN